MPHCPLVTRCGGISRATSGHWLTIQSAADRYNPIAPELFAREFGGANSLLKERQCFLLDPKHAVIGTATAWFNENFKGDSWGRLHWVAIVPEQQGRGLAKLLRTVSAADCATWETPAPI